MIKISNLSKAYENHKIFEEQTLNMADGNIYALVGVNGIGKSTLLNAIILPATIGKGDILIDNVKSTDFKSKYNIAYVSDSKDMFLNLTGYEYLLMVGKLYKRENKELQKELQSYVTQLKLEKSLNELISNYSLGMKQKVYLIGALLSGAKNLILDEPFNGLDPESVAILKGILTSYRDKGNLVLFSIHNLDLVANFCDKVVFIDKNHEIFECENPQEFKALEQIFFSRCVVND